MHLRYFCNTSTRGLCLAALTLLLTVVPAKAANANAFVVSSIANTVTIIDTATSTVRATVAVGLAPSRVAVSPDGTKAYVSHPTLSYVSVIDATTLGISTTIPTNAGPAALSVTPDGTRLFVGVTGAVQVIDLSTGTAVATIPLAGTATDIAFTPDGARAYVAAGILSVIDTNTLAVTGTSVLATSIAMMPSGQAAYVVSSTGLSLVSTSTNSVTQTLTLTGTPGPLALTPDGSRLYVGVQGSNLVCSVYGCGGVAFRNIAVISTYANAAIGTISISAPAARLAVTPNRKDLYITIPNTSVSIASINTNAIRLTIPVGSGVNGLAIAEPGAVIFPYVIDAVNDTAAATVISSIGGTAVPNVLVNDRLGGFAATLANVTLSQVSSTHPSVSLNTTTGAVAVEIGTPAGPHSVVYQICETASPTNCDQATVSLNVRLPYVIDAVDDSAISNTGKTAINALLNDTLNALPANTATVRVTQLSSTHPGIAITASGLVNVASGTPMGPQSLVYRICEAASLTNCDEARVSIDVIPYVVDAVNDIGSTTRSGGIAVANVLANDKFGTGTATLANVALTLVSSTNAQVTLNLANGAVSVAAGAPLGSHSLVYRICEIASPANCDSATVSLTVNPYLIDAMNDSARGSSKVANTPLASVLTNDRLAGAPATVSTVSLSLVSLSPANSKIRLDLTDGSVDVLGKTSSGYYTLVYRICEIANPTNCDQATVSLDLSGGGN